MITRLSPLKNIGVLKKDDLISALSISFFFQGRMHISRTTIRKAKENLSSLDEWNSTTEPIVIYWSGDSPLPRLRELFLIKALIGNRI